MKNVIVTTLFILICISSNAQSIVDSSNKKRYQAKAPKTIQFGKEAFLTSNVTTIRWLGMAGFHVNSRGTNFMIDPLLKDMICHY